MHRNSDTPPVEGPVLGQEELRMARLARLESKERLEKGGDGQPERKLTTLKREDIKEMERILVLEWCDERHNSAATLVGRAQRLTKILSKALLADGDDKFRKLRYNNPVVQREILACPPTEKLLRAVGWTSLVEANERYLVFNHGKDSREAQLSERLIKRLSEVQKKEQMRADLKDQQKIMEQKRLERARLLLDDDHIDRKERQQRMLEMHAEGGDEAEEDGKDVEEESDEGSGKQGGEEPR